VGRQESKDVLRVYFWILDFRFAFSPNPKSAEGAQSKI
jgi:hypothetical protein